MKAKPRPALATGKVRYVGEAYAVVIAETVAQGKDAAEAVMLEIEPLPAITTIAEALAPGAPTHPRRSAGQRHARLSFRQHRGGERGLRQGGACHAS